MIEFIVGILIGISASALFAALADPYYRKQLELMDEDEDSQERGKDK